MFEKRKRRKRKAEIYKAMMTQEDNFNPDNYLKSLEDLEIMSELVDEFLELKCKVEAF